eukprot:1315178-Pleurochrysis_carterae.AAC.1
MLLIPHGFCLLSQGYMELSARADQAACDAHILLCVTMAPGCSARGKHISPCQMAPMTSISIPCAPGLLECVLSLFYFVEPWRGRRGEFAIVSFSEPRPL